MTLPPLTSETTWMVVSRGRIGDRKQRRYRTLAQAQAAYDNAAAAGRPAWLYGPADPEDTYARRPILQHVSREEREKHDG